MCLKVDRNRWEKWWSQFSQCATFKTFLKKYQKKNTTKNDNSKDSPEVMRCFCAYRSRNVNTMNITHRELRERRPWKASEANSDIWLLLKSLWKANAKKEKKHTHTHTRADTDAQRLETDCHQTRRNRRRKKERNRRKSKTLKWAHCTSRRVKQNLAASSCTYILLSFL